jgi:hypothetical protein
MSDPFRNTFDKNRPDRKLRARAGAAARRPGRAARAIAARAHAPSARMDGFDVIEEPAIPPWVVALLVAAAILAVVAILLVVLLRPGGPLALAPAATATATLLAETPSPEGAAATAEATLEPTLATTPEPTAPATLEPTAEPTGEPTAEPTTAPPTDTPAAATPTATVAPTWTPCSTEIDPGLAPIWERQGFGCALETAVLGAWAYQPTERGMMFWSEGRDSIFMLANDGRWTEMIDEWDETKPELSCEATPPEGLIQPKRGFGLAWCSQPAMRDALGFALAIEDSTDARMQRVESGYLLYHVARGTAYLLRPDGTWAGLAAP